MRLGGVCARKGCVCMCIDVGVDIFGSLVSVFLQKVSREGNDIGWGLPLLEHSVGILFLSSGVFISGSVILKWLEAPWWREKEVQIPPPTLFIS